MTAATPACSSPTRYEAQPRSSSTNCRNNTTATLPAGAAISPEVRLQRAVDRAVFRGVLVRLAPVGRRLLDARAMLQRHVVHGIADAAPRTACADREHDARPVARAHEDVLRPG